MNSHIFKRDGGSSRRPSYTTVGSIDSRKSSGNTKSKSNRTSLTVGHRPITAHGAVEAYHWFNRKIGIVTNFKTWNLSGGASDSSIC